MLLYKKLLLMTFGTTLVRQDLTTEIQNIAFYQKNKIQSQKNTQQIVVFCMCGGPLTHRVCMGPIYTTTFDLTRIRSM